MTSVAENPGLRFEDFRNSTDPDLFAKVTDLERYVTGVPQPCLEALGVELLGPAAARATMREHDGTVHPVVMLGSNSYLGLTTDPRVVGAAVRACHEYGYGTGAVPLYTGTTSLHRQLEELIARFYGAEEAMLFPCGYTTNIGVISALCGEGDLILNDAHNHASIFDGCGLSGADVRVYLHRNTRHLEKLLRQHRDPHRGGCLIATDGVFSMDGDLAPLPRILELAREHNARVLIDEAHAVGVIGTSGRGTAEHFGCQGRVDITVGTLSKAPGAVGGYCVGSAALIQYLRLYARTHFFSTSLPPPVVAGLIEVFHILMDDPDLHRRLWENVTYLRQGVKAAGFRIGDTESAIIPIIVGDEERLAAFSNATRRRGVVGNLVSYPAVRRKECRLRLNVMATLTKEDMDFALRILTEEGRRTGVLA